MVRRYDPDRPVPDAVLDLLLEHATRAPSAGFSQGWDFVVLRDAPSRQCFWAATRDPDEPPDAWCRGVMTAPVLVVCLSDRNAYLRRYAEPDKGWAVNPTEDGAGRWPVPYWHVDTAMAALLMLLTAVDQGLGGLFFGVPPERHQALLAALHAPADRVPTAVLSIGYPAPDRRSPSLRRGRRPVTEVAHEGRLGIPYRMADAPPPGGPPAPGPGRSGP
jgi:nitroreductase